MTKKVNKLSKGHRYDLGAAMAAIDMLGAIGPTIAQIPQRVKGIDLEPQINQVNTFGNLDYNVGDVDDILNFRSANGPLEHKDKYDFTGGSVAGDISGYLTDITSNGGLAGLKIIPNIIGEINTQRNINKYNTAVDNANARNDWSLMNAISNQKANLFNVNALGGPIFRDPFSNGVTEINEGGTHENNPHEGVPVGVAPDGLPNLVEEGEVIYKDYVFSNRLRVPEAIRKKYKLRGTKDITFAEAFRKAQEESEERENDPISKNGLDNIAMILARTQETIRQKNMRHKKAEGGHLFSGLDDPYTPENIQHYLDIVQNTLTDGRELDLLNGFDSVKPLSTNIKKPTGSLAPINRGSNTTTSTSSGENFSSIANLARMAPIFASAGAVASDMLGLTNRPTVYDQIPAFTPVGFKPITNYLPNTRIDTRYDANRQAQQAAATAAAIRQNFTPGKYGNLLAADLNAQIAQGNLLREAQLAQIELDRKREEFNRGTNQANSELALRTGLGNQGSRLSYAQAALQQAKANTDETNASMGARAANISGLADNIAGAATERDQRRWIQALVDAGVIPIGFRVANGGRIRRKKKGLTC